MLSGKAVSMAVLGYMLINRALNCMLMSEVFGILVPHRTATQKGFEQESTATEQSFYETNE